jgi:hypothetical protein
MTSLGQGGSIPLCNVFANVYPAGSVDPRAIAIMALTEALLLQHYPAALQQKESGARR